MRQAERDVEQLGFILNYCSRLDSALEHFGNDYRRFESSWPFQDSCALCLVQIGEAVNRLSDEFKAANPQIEWHRIYGMRNHLVHAYESFDPEIAWDSIHTDIPPLRAFCQERYQP